MADHPEIAHLLDLPMALEATLAGPILRVEELLELGVGSMIPTQSAAGETIDVFAGGARIGRGELGGARGRTTVRMVWFQGQD
ncbi:MAG TPA: FliM/FliN family flagellar motor C-terminal domain-containing protein [Verrucomicrobiae bacterium]|nr:FliM/FliN family flagellar motor C-terminal domain-containing protein [Verrucomicrobiae bacterium]